MHGGERRERSAVPSEQRDGEGTDVTESVSESENPGIPSPTPKPHRPRSNKDWWPDQPDLLGLRGDNPRSNPMGQDFSSAEEVKKLDVAALKRDLVEGMANSEDWWPADFGH